MEILNYNTEFYCASKYSHQRTVVAFVVGVVLLELTSDKIVHFFQSHLLLCGLFNKIPANLI